MTTSFAARSAAFWLLGWGTLLLPSSGRAASTISSPRDERVGFFLLSDVCQQETQVHLITLIKTTPPGVVDFVKHVSQRADDSMAAITRLETADPSLKLDQNPLPAFEQRVRDSIRADKQHQLLFGTKGPDFAKALLVTQIEATNYILNIAKDLADSDSDPDRARTLRKMSAQWRSLRDEAFRLLDAS